MLKRLRILLLLLCLLPSAAWAAGNAALFAAVEKGDPAQVAALMPAGSDANARNGAGETLLHAAAGTGHLDVADLLIAWRAQVDARVEGMTPLHYAAYNRQVDVAGLLISKGADVDARDDRGLTPLHVGAGGGAAAVLALLLDHGAHIEAANTFGQTPLHWAASFGYPDCVEVLLAHGAAIDAQDQAGDTALHMAAFQGNAASVALLLAKGAEFNRRNAAGQTPLQVAAANERPRVVELLEARLVQRGLLNAQGALAQLTDQLASDPDDDTARRLAFRLAAAISPAPAVPDAARKRFAEGEAAYGSAVDSQGAARAARAFAEAVRLAPWWASAYYNLGLAYDLAGEPKAAATAFHRYLLSDPPLADRRQAIERMDTLSAVSAP